MRFSWIWLSDWFTRYLVARKTKLLNNLQLGLGSFKRRYFKSKAYCRPYTPGVCMVYAFNARNTKKWCMSIDFITVSLNPLTWSLHANLSLQWHQLIEKQQTRDDMLVAPVSALRANILYIKCWWFSFLLLFMRCYMPHKESKYMYVVLKRRRI